MELNEFAKLRNILLDHYVKKNQYYAKYTITIKKLLQWARQ